MPFLFLRATVAVVGVVLVDSGVVQKSITIHLDPNNPPIRIKVKSVFDFIADNEMPVRGCLTN